MLLNRAEWMGKGKQAAKEEPRLLVSQPVPSLAAAVAPEPAPEPLSKPLADIAVEIRANEIFLTLGDRRYRVRGLDKNTTPEVTKVSLMVTRGEAFHADTVNLPGGAAAGCVCSHCSR